jgi:hypothetical protein
LISKGDVMPLLLEACPSFRAPWQAFVSDSLYDPTNLYSHLGEFARHLVGLMKAKKTEEFSAVFAVVERLHVEGDGYVSEAATIGLLEGIQNISGGKVDPESFLPFLERDSWMYWQALNEFWDGQS